MLKSYLKIAILLPFLVGCSSQPPKSNVKIVREADPLSQIRTIAVLSTERLQKLQAAEEERRQQNEKRYKQQQLRPDKIPAGWEKRATLVDQGYPDVMCERLALMAGYTGPSNNGTNMPVHLGNRPNTPVDVNINKVNVPLWEIAQELGYKSSAYFVMEIYEEPRMVRCIYREGKHE